MSDPKKPAMDPNEIVLDEDGDPIRPGRFGTDGEGVEIILAEQFDDPNEVVLDEDGDDGSGMTIEPPDEDGDDTDDDEE